MKLAKTVLCCAVIFGAGCDKDDDSGDDQGGGSDEQTSQQQPVVLDQPDSGQNDQNSGSTDLSDTGDADESDDDDTPPANQEPSISIQQLPSDPTYAVSATVAFTAGDSDGSVASVQCRLDSGTYATCLNSATYNNLTPGGHVVHIRVEDDDGSITTRSVTWWQQDAGFTGAAVQGESSKNNLRGLYVADDGTVYLSSADGIGYGAYDGAFAWIEDGTIGSADVSAVIVDGTTIYAGTNFMLYRSTDGGGTFANSYGVNEGLGNSNVYAMAKASDGTLYVATSAGLAVSDDLEAMFDDNFINRTTADGLSANAVYAVFVDGDDTVYAGGQSGLDRSTDGGVTFSAVGNLGTMVTGIHVQGDSIYVSKNTGVGISHDGGATFVHRDMDDGLPAAYVNDIVAYGDFIIAGTGSGLAISFDGGESFSTYGEGDGLYSDSITSLAITPEGRLLVGTGDGMSYANDLLVGGGSFSEAVAPVVAQRTVSVDQAAFGGGDFSWSAATDAATAAHDLRYAVFYSTQDNIDSVEGCYGNGSLYGSYLTNETSVELRGLNPGQTYFLNVVAIDESGNKTAYAGTSFTALSQLAWTEQAATTPFAARWYHESVVHDGRLYVVAGYQNGGGGTVLDDVWSTAGDGNWTNHIPFNSDGDGFISSSVTERFGHKTASFKGKIYMIGGMDSTLAYKKDVQTSTDGATWTEVTASLHADFEPRQHHALVVHDGKLWIMGGAGESGGTAENYADVWYSSDGANWTEATSAAAFGDRKYHSALSYDGKLWIMGGYNGGALSTVYSSTDGVTWTLESTGAIDSRTNHTAVTFGDQMWVVGGDNTYDVKRSDDGISWFGASNNDTGFPGREWHSSVVFNGQVWMIHGNYFGTKADIFVGQ